MLQGATAQCNLLWQVAGEAGVECSQEQLGVRVVPLLETLKDLQNAAKVLSDLLAVPWYRKHVRCAHIKLKNRVLIRCAHHRLLCVLAQAGLLASLHDNYWRPSRTSRPRPRSCRTCWPCPGTASMSGEALLVTGLLVSV